MPSKPPRRKTASEARVTPGQKLFDFSHYENPETARRLDPGSVIAGRYTVRNVAGVGGMCLIYRVSDRERPERKIALKIVSGKTNPLWAETLRNEFSILTRLEHENLVRVFDFGILPDEEGFFYTSEYVEGLHLDEAARRGSEDELIDCIVQLCRCLEYIHARGYIHFDIKPGNVLVTSEGAVKLVDFGLAAFSDRVLGRKIRGTPAYTSPEMLTGAEVDFRADLYSLGVCLYEIVAGTHPFKTRDLQELFRRHVTEQPVPLRKIKPGVPEYLERVVLRLLAKNPADRFESANAVIGALSRGRGIQIELQPPSSTEGYLRNPPLTARKRELEALRKALDGLQSGESSYVSVEGRPGIGRSRLLKDIYFEAQLRGFAACTVNAGEAGVFDRMLRSLSSRRGIEVPGSGTAGNERDGFVPDGSTSAFPETVAGVLAIARHIPVVLCVDDMQDAPKEVRKTVLRLAQLLGTSIAPTLMLVTAWKYGEKKEPVVTDDTVKLVPEPLNLEEVGKVVRGMFGSSSPPELFVKRLHEATGGIPFSIVETVRMLVTSGEIAVIEGKWRFRGGDKRFKVPPSVKEYYGVLVGKLPGFSHRLAFTLALMGRAVRMSEISALHAKERPRRIADTLSELVRKGLIRNEHGRVKISDESIRKAIIESRSRSTQQRRHGETARCLEKLRKKGIARLEIARHYLEAGIKDDAVRHGLAAIRAGEIEKDPEAAAHVLERLLSAAGKGDRNARIKLVYSLITAQEYSSDPGAILSLIEEYRSLATKSERRERRMRIEHTAAACYGMLNERDKADTAWRKAVDLAGPGSGEYFRLLADYAAALEHWGRSADGERILQDAIDGFPDGEPREMLRVYTSLGYMAMHQGQSDKMKTCMEKAHALAGKSGLGADPFITNMLGLVSMLEGDYSKAEENYLVAREKAIEHNDQRMLAEISVRLTQVCFHFERIDEALQYAAEAESIRLRYGDFSGLVVLYRILGRETHIRLGYSVSLKYLEKGVEFARLAGSVMMEYAILNTLGDVACLGGDFEKAIGYAERSLALAERKLKLPPAASHLIRATTYSLSGNPREALDYAKRGLEAALKMSEPETIIDARTRACSVALFAGDLKLALDQVGELEKLLPQLHVLHGFNIRMVTAAVWFALGQFGKVAGILESISSEPAAMELDLFRAMWTSLNGDLAVRRFRFDEAEKAFHTVQNLLSRETNLPAYLDLLCSRVELELHRRDADAVAVGIGDLDKMLAELPGEMVYYRLRLNVFQSKKALLTGDRESAYEEAITGLLRAKGAGYRLLEIELSKLAAETSRKKREAVELRAGAERLAVEIASSLDEELRKTVEEYLLAPLVEVPGTSPGPGKTGEDINESLIQLAVFLSREENPQRAVEAVIDMAFRSMDAKRAFIVIRGEGGLRFRAGRNVSGFAPDSPEDEVSSSVINRVIDGGEPVFSAKAVDDEALKSYRSIVELELMSILAVPMRIGGEVEGCLYLDNSRKAAAFATGDERLAQYLASLAGAVLERQLLLQQFRETSESLKYKLERQTARFDNIQDQLKSARRLRGLDLILGQSLAVRRLKESVRRSASVNLPVLLLGETGTGKDIVAKVIHEISGREGDFITVNCGAIPETLFQSELFGVERGAFTGAEETRPGLLEIADGGTVYFDEISDLPPSAQTTLLRALAEGNFRKIGGREDIKVDIRIISSSGRDISEMTAREEFRQDLLYRLNTLEIRTPPLREREGDVPVLAAEFLENFAGETGRPAKVLTYNALQALEAYEWPGNITELRNVLRKAFVIAEERIDIDSILLAEGEQRKGAPQTRSPEKLEDIEREHILRIFAASNNRLKPTARALGIARNTLRRKLALYRKAGYLSE
ncbi:MAG: sigma 54-interacting transcriptional regulator [Planctomycetota bacterium]|jgi:transcriptional regulator with GAF, ATPase, and Fis domain/serine/threonine protein kinase